MLAPTPVLRIRQRAVSIGIIARRALLSPWQLGVASESKVAIRSGSGSKQYVDCMMSDPRVLLSKARAFFVRRNDHIIRSNEADIPSS